MTEHRLVELKQLKEGKSNAIDQPQFILLVEVKDVSQNSMIKHFPCSF